MIHKDMGSKIVISTQNESKSEEVQNALTKKIDRGREGASAKLKSKAKNHQGWTPRAREFH